LIIINKVSRFFLRIPTDTYEAIRRAKNFSRKIFHQKFEISENQTHPTPSMPKSRPNTPKEDASDWEKVHHRRHRDKPEDRDTDRDRTKKPGSQTKTKPEENESTPSRTTSLAGKRSWATDSDSDGTVDPKRTPTHSQSHDRTQDRSTPTPTPTRTTSSKSNPSTPTSSPSPKVTTSSKSSTNSGKPDNQPNKPSIQKIPTVLNSTQTSLGTQVQPSASWANDEPEQRPTYASAAKKQKAEFKKPLPIPDWKDLELRIFKTSYRQVPISHREFNDLRDKLYDYVLQHLKANPGPKEARLTEATHNQWSAALQCGLWDCNNRDSLNWYRDAIAKVTNKEFRGWAKHEKSTQLIKIFPHESFAKYSAPQFLETIHYYHLDLNINAWKILLEYSQVKGRRVLVVEVPTQLLDMAKKKATHSESGIWRLQGMAMPMRFAMATPGDLQRSNPDQGQNQLKELATTPTRPQTPHTPSKPPAKSLDGPKVAQPGSTTPITTAMSGFSLASPFRPNQPITTAPIPPSQGDYFAIYDVSSQTLVPVGNSGFIPQPYYPQTINPSYQVMPQPYQPNQIQYQQFQQPLQQNIPQQIQTLTQVPPPPPPPPTNPTDQPTFSPEEIDEALKIDNMEEGHADLSDSDSELLREDDESAPKPRT